MEQIKKKMLLIALFSCVTLLSTGCAEYSLEMDLPTEVLKTKGEICLDTPQKERVNKILFVVDKSGSNYHDGVTPGAGNDPDDVRRADNIQAFLDENRGNPYQEYGYIVFGVETNKAQSYINKGDFDTPRFGDENDLQSAIDQHRSVADNGCTPYLAALQLAKRTIELDMEDNPQQDAVYNVFFMSDGFPNDANSAVQCSSTVAVTDDSNDPYIKAVEDVVSILPNRIFLSAAYYTLPANDPGRAAAEGLSHMANAGGGKFVDLQSDDKINFDEIRVGPTPESWIIKRMMVHNLNSAMCTDGIIGADSDADGVCDSDEILFNKMFADRLPSGRQFDPTKRNSLHDDYSDMFSYRFDILPTGEGLPTCRSKEADEDMDLLNSCEELALGDVQANGPTPQWTDGIRNAGGGIASTKNPDSDGDGFLDSMEYFQFGVKSAAVNYQNIFDRYTGGVTAETLMTDYRHPMHPDRVESTDTDFRVTFSRINTQGQNCYNVALENLALFDTQALTLDGAGGLSNITHEANENVLLVYYIATQENNPNGKGYFMHKFHRVKSHGITSKSFLFSDYELYKVPEEF